MDFSHLMLFYVFQDGDLNGNTFRSTLAIGYLENMAQQQWIIITSEIKSESIVIEFLYL